MINDFKTRIGYLKEEQNIPYIFNGYVGRHCVENRLLFLDLILLVERVSHSETIIKLIPSHSKGLSVRPIP